MTLCLLESWDMIATANLGAKGWTTIDSQQTVQTSGGRTGAQCFQSIQDAGGKTAGIYQVLPGALQHATLISGFALNLTSKVGTPPGWFIEFLGDSNTTNHVGLSITSGGYIAAYRGTPDSGTLLGTSSAQPIVAGAGWQYIEVLVTLSGIAGVVTVRINNNIVLNLTAQNTKNGGTATVLDTLKFGGLSANASPSNYMTTQYDDVYLANGAGTVNNTFLGDTKVVVLRPTGNGGVDQFVNDAGNSTNNYSHVNATLAQSTTYAGSSTVGQEDLYTTGGVSGTSGTITGTQVCALASKTDTGSRSIVPVIRQGTTDYLGTSQVLTYGSNVYMKQINETDPSTSAAWTITGLNAAQFGAQVA